jgi:hypothetical protein
MDRKVVFQNKKTRLFFRGPGLKVIKFQLIMTDRNFKRLSNEHPEFM